MLFVGLLKKFKKRAKRAVTPPKKFRRRVKRAVTPPKKFRRRVKRAVTPPKKFRRRVKRAFTPPKKIRKLSAKKIIKSVGKVTTSAAKASFEVAVFPLGLTGRVQNGVLNNLTRLEDMTGIPGIRLVGGLLVGRPPISTIMQMVETYSKGTKSRQFSVSKSTMNLFNNFIKANRNFPYNKTYRKIRWYYKANNPKGAITFENRVYMNRKRSENKICEVSLLFHEYVHTFQYRKYGKMVFALVYTGSYLRNLIPEPKKAYERINFEREAYNWDKKFCNWLKKTQPKFKKGDCDCH